MSVLSHRVTVLSPACPGGASPNRTTLSNAAVEREAERAGLDAAEYARRQHEDSICKAERAARLEASRPSPILHNLRFWFRALAYAHLGPGSTGRVRQAETSLFGGLKPQPAPARFRLWITDPQLEFQAFQSGSIYEPSCLTRAGEPLSYLGYGLQQRMAILPGSSFTVKVSAAGGSAGVRELISALLPLAIHLSGFGARARHGLGSLAFVENPLTADGIVKAIGDASGCVGEYLREVANGGESAAAWTGEQIPEFPCVGHEFLRIARRKTKNWTSEIYTMWRKHRLIRTGDLRHSRNSPFYHQYLENPSARPAGSVEFTGLGLPLNFGITNVGRRGSIVPAPRTGVANENLQRAKKIGRRASPIHFRLLRDRDGKLAVAALLWLCEYLPEDLVEIKVQSWHLPEYGLASAGGEAERWFEHHITAANGWQSLALDPNA